MYLHLLKINNINDVHILKKHTETVRSINEMKLSSSSKIKRMIHC